MGKQHLGSVWLLCTGQDLTNATLLFQHKENLLFVIGIFVTKSESPSCNNKLVNIPSRFEFLGTPDQISKYKLKTCNFNVHVKMFPMQYFPQIY